MGLIGAFNRWTYNLNNLEKLRICCFLSDPSLKCRFSYSPSVRKRMQSYFADNVQAGREEGKPSLMRMRPEMLGETRSS